MSELEISGEWVVEEEWWPENGRHHKDKYKVIIDQNEQSIKMGIEDVTKPVLGKLKGNTASMDGYSFPEDDGTTKVSDFFVEFFNGGESGNGRDSWIWQGYSGRESQKGKSESKWTKVSSICDVNEEPKKDLEKIKGTEDKKTIKRKFEEAKKEITRLGGLKAFKSGEWLLNLVRKSFKDYRERANADYFRNKYKTKDNDSIAKRLTEVAARNAGILGGVTGAVVSTDEIFGFFTAGEGGIGLPANIGIAVTALVSEAIVLVRFQLELVANLGKLYGVPLDPDDPEDILIILAFAVGGSVAEEAGKFGMKVGGRVSGILVKKYIAKETLEALRRIFAKMGVKILQRTILKYVVPLASIVVGSGWNYLTTKAVGKIARKHFLSRRKEFGIE